MPRALLDALFSYLTTSLEPRGPPLSSPLVMPPTLECLLQSETSMVRLILAKGQGQGAENCTYCVCFSNCHLLRKSDLRRIRSQPGLLCSTDEGRFGGLEKEQRAGEFSLSGKNLTFATLELRCLSTGALCLTDQ